MAILTNGINGPATGRIGDLLFYLNKRGQLICRTIGVKTSSKGGELANQKGTALTTALLDSVKEFIKIGFQNIPPDKNWHYYNYATSVNKLNAIKGIYPNQEIDYQKVMFSIGDLPLPKNPKVTLNNSVIDFTWDADMETAGTDRRDQVMLVAYFPESMRSICLASGARRTEETEKLKLPLFTKKAVIETYISFIGDDRKTLSNTVYAGQLIWDKK